MYVCVCVCVYDRCIGAGEMEQVHIVRGWGMVLARAGKRVIFNE